MSRIRKALEKAKADRVVVLETTLEAPCALDVDPGPKPAPCASTREIHVSREHLSAMKVVAVDESDPLADCFKLLRTRIIQATREKRWNAIQVTGFEPGSGKSTLSVNLAVALAKDTRHTTLLVDLDFRRPSIHKFFGLNSGFPGLKSYFLEDVPLEDVLFSPGIEHLEVLPAMESIPNAPELIGSRRMEILVRELKSKYPDRYIIFDSPALNVCPDPVILSEYVDAILLVARSAHTSFERIQAAMELIDREKILGVVLNECTDVNVSDYYGYRKAQ